MSLKKLIILFVLVCVLASSCAPIYLQGKRKQEQIDRLVAQIDTLYKAKDWDNALKITEKLAKLDKTNRGFYYSNIGRILEKKNEEDKAIKIYKRSISKYKNSQWGYYNLGRIYFNHGVEQLDRANQIYDNDRYHEQYLVEKEKAKEYFRQALSLFEKGLELNPNNKMDYYFALRMTYYNLGMMDKFDWVEKIIEKIKVINFPFLEQRRTKKISK